MFLQLYLDCKLFIPGYQLICKKQLSQYPATKPQPEAGYYKFAPLYNRFYFKLNNEMFR